MEHVADLLFMLNLAFIATHELDAVAQHEWRVLPITSWMTDTWGYRAFIPLHIPLFVIIFWAMPSRDFQIGMDIFLVIHAGLHLLFRNHPDYTFDNLLSRFLIFGVVPLAVLHLIWIM